MAPQLAWVGLGNMGRGMAKNLVEKGNLSKPLLVFNRTFKRAEDFAAARTSEKVKPVSSLEEAVKASDIVFMCLPDDKTVEDTAAQIVAMDVSGKLIVDCSTIHPTTTNNVAKTVTSHKASFVAVPVFGAPAMAEAGQVITALAGPKADVDRVKPYTTGVIGRADIDLSDQMPGQATLLKIIGNTFILQMVEALSEGHAVAEKSGLGHENLQKFISAMFPGPYEAYSGRMMQGDYYKRKEPQFGVDLARKDARHALDIANASGAKMKAVELVDSHLKAVQDHMGSKGDIAGIYGAVRQESGLKFEN